MRKVIGFMMAGLLLLTGDNSQAQKKPDGPKKIRLLPVYLVYTGLPADTALDRIVKEAFTRHKVELIDKRKFDQVNEGEVQRVETKFRARNDQFSSEADVRRAIASEQRFVTNLLVVGFDYKVSGDSVSVVSATWEGTPFPPNINSSRSSGKVETTLPDTCCSARDNIFSIIDKILLSKWLR